MRAFHILEMLGMRPFSIKIEPDPLGARWFRWSLFEEGELLIRSQFSYPTRRQAKDGANVAMQKRAFHSSVPSDDQNSKAPAQSGAR
jgi:hypothetical protein